MDDHIHSLAASAPVASASAAAAAPLDAAALLRYVDQLNSFQHRQHQTILKMLDQQAAAAAANVPAAQQMLGLASLGMLPNFAGQADASGMAAREWLQKAEHHFSVRETTLGVSAAQGDTFRVHSARAALTGDALRWLMALPSPPSTWQEFKTAFANRFSSVPAAQVREQQLRQFVSAAHRLRDKLNVEGLQRYTTLFLQRAGEIPSGRMTEATKRHLYSQGLPTRYAEMVLTEDAEAEPMALHEVAQHVLAKATMKTYAGASAGYQIEEASTTQRDGDAMDVDAVSLCAAHFGVTRDEAAAYCTTGRDGMHAAWSDVAPARGSPPTTPPSTELLAQLLAAIAAPRQQKGTSMSPSAGCSKPGFAMEDGLVALLEDFIAAWKQARQDQGFNRGTDTTGVADGTQRVGSKQNF
jgi:hypothetical protein